MIYTLSLRSQFAASHILKGHPLCDKTHGHTYDVQVTVIGDPDPDTFNMVADEAEFRKRLDSLLYEVNYRHLNDQLPAVIPSVQGIANWIWERLSIDYQVHEV